MASAWGTLCYHILCDRNGQFEMIEHLRKVFHIQPQQHLEIYNQVQNGLLNVVGIMYESSEGLLCKGQKTGVDGFHPGLYRV